MPYIAPIVEGHGEVEAVPALLQRIAEMEAPDRLLEVNRPIRVKAGSFLNDQDYFKRYVTLASSKAQNNRPPANWAQNSPTGRIRMPSSVLRAWGSRQTTRRCLMRG